MLSTNRQMAFLIGPRQVGKTWIARNIGPNVVYFTWDSSGDRKILLDGGADLIARSGLDRLLDHPPVLVFDELHKWKDWKNFLKGFFDTWEGRCRILVTGSAALDAFSKGGDSLMGRYFLFRCHPFSWTEILEDGESRIDRESAWSALREYGGFPEPFLRADREFWRRWKSLRWRQLFREDIRDLTRSLELDRIETLGALLLEQATGQCNWSKLAGRLKVSEESVVRWVHYLESLHTLFLVRPWSRNIARSLIKEPRIFFTDWSWIKDGGARAENFIASQVRAQLDLWQDLGQGEFALFYVRDKDGREADFLIARDGEPWILLEVKLADTKLAAGFLRMAGQAGARWNFQLVVDLPGVAADPFARGPEPLVVPARTFLEHWRLDQG